MASPSSRNSRSCTSSTLSQLQDDIVLPSTLNYKERTELRRKDAYEYGRIYNTSSIRGMNVHDRLTADAAVRQTLKAQTLAAAPADADNFASLAKAAAITAAATSCAGMDKSSSSGSSRKTHVISGFVHNNNANITCKQQAADTACTAEAPLSALHPITLKSYYKKYPMDFLAAARPQARTTNETLRMLGTFHSDEAVAQQLGVHIPHGCSCAGLDKQQ